MSSEIKALKSAKRALRLRMRSRLASISSDSIDSQSRKVTHLLTSLPEYVKARKIGVYLSMPTAEISTKATVLHALQENKNVFIPYIYHFNNLDATGMKSAMDMVSLQSPQDYESLQPDPWGIPTPSEESLAERKYVLGAKEIGHCRVHETKQEDLEVIIMPGVAFDRKLSRLGHGKGFYDSFLQCYQKLRIPDSSGSTKNKMPFLVGLALEEQLLPPKQEVPTDSSDWALDALIVGDGTVLRKNSKT